MASQGEGHRGRQVECGSARGGGCRDRGHGDIRVATTGDPASHRMQLLRPELVALGVDARPEHRCPDAVAATRDDVDRHIEHTGGQPFPAGVHRDECPSGAAQHDRRTVAGPDGELGVGSGGHDHVRRWQIAGADRRSSSSHVGIEHLHTVLLVDHRPRRARQPALVLDLRRTATHIGRAHVAVSRIGGDGREHVSSHRTPEEFEHRDDRAPISGRTERRNRRRRRDRADLVRRRRRTTP